MQFITDYSRLLERPEPYVVFDLETTGLNNRTERIIELAAIRYSGGRVVDKFVTMVNPGKPIPEEASRINGIYDKDVAEAPLIESVLPPFREYIEGAILVAHNAPFDTGFINKALGRMDYPLLENGVVDTKPLAQSAFPGQRSYSQVNLARFLSISVKDAHRAEDDARVCLELFLACARHLAHV